MFPQRKKIMLNFKKMFKCLPPVCLTVFLVLSLYFSVSFGAAYAEYEGPYDPGYEEPPYYDSTEEPETDPDETEEPPETEDTEETEPFTEDTEDTEPTEPPVVLVPEMQLSFRETNLEIGQGIQLNASVINSPEPNPPIAFLSSNTAVARVDSSGYIIATGEGRTVITAFWDDVMSSATVTVTAPPVVPEYIVVTKSEFQLKIGAAAQIEARLLPEEIAAVYVMTYTTENTNVVSVNENGLITAVGAGEAYIKVESGGITETVHVTVSEDIAYDHAKLDGYLYGTNGKPIAGAHMVIDNLSAVTDSRGYFIFAEAEQRELTLSISSDSDARCTVSLTGDVTVYLLYSKGNLTRRSSYDELAGLLPINSASFDTQFNNIVLTVGQVESLTYQYAPKDAVITEILYSSSNSLVAQIGQIDGVITAKSPGEATITLSLNGGQAEAVCTVTVNPKESSQYSMLIMITEFAAIAVAAAAMFLAYRRYKTKNDAELDSDGEEDGDLHDIE